MQRPNEMLRRARERLPSPGRPGKETSRAEVAGLVNELLFTPGQAKYSPFNANYLGKLERGQIRWPLARYRAALREVLCVASDEELGFYDPVAQRAEAVRGARLFDGFTGVSGVSIGSDVSTGVAAPDFELLTSSSPEVLPRQVGRDHINYIVDVANLIKGWDNKRGGGLTRDIADQQLRRAARLLTIDCPAGLSRELHTAIAQLAGVVGFALFDACAQVDARRRFEFALQCAQIGGDWHRRAKLLASMARQAIWCGRPDEGLTYAEMGLVRADRLTATERAMLHTVRARALARRGPSYAQEALAAVGAADEAFAHADPTDDLPGMRFYDEAQHQGDTAHALFDVAMRTSLATDAAGRFAFAVSHHRPEYQRSRAISRTKLAMLTMATGDPLHASHIGHQALDDATGLRSRRMLADLRQLGEAARGHAGVAEVAALRARIDSMTDNYVE